MDYKVWQQWVTDCVRCWITECGKMDYKVHWGLQSVAGLQSDLVQPLLHESKNNLPKAKSSYSCLNCVKLASVIFVSILDGKI